MPSLTTIRVTDASGTFLFETAQFIDVGDNPGLHYVLSCGLVGALTVTLPPEFNDRLPKDGRIHVMRSVNGGAAAREGGSCFLIRKWVYADDYTTVTALHANHIFWRRYALWSWASSASETAGVLTADDQIKSGGSSVGIWWLNFAAGAAAGALPLRDSINFTQADISATVSLQADTGAAPIVYESWYWQNCGDAIRLLCDGSMTSGTYLTAEIVAPTESTLELQTFTGQRGADRRFSTGSGILFTEGRGNLANALLTVDATEEVTVAVAGGATRDSSTSLYAAVDTTRIAESPLGRIEAFVDSNSVDAQQIQGDADARVRAGRPVIVAVADLQETDNCLRGVDYDYGDLVTVDVVGVQYDMRLDVLDVTLTGGVETTKAGFYYNG